jgi:hypothetical protein
MQIVMIIIGDIVTLEVRMLFHFISSLSHICALGSRQVHRRYWSHLGHSKCSRTIGWRCICRQRCV